MPCSKQTTTIPHQVISASAGSGKTYQLSNRYLKLLLCGAAPESIVALTFTRKAAGEIFDRIVGRLAEGVMDADQRRAIAADTHPDLTASELCGHLRAMIQQMSKLRIGTIDSFMVQIVRAFSLELGIQSDFELIDGFRQQQEMMRVLRRVLGRDKEKEERQALVEACKQVSFGAEERRIADAIKEMIETWHRMILLVPEKYKWGGFNAIWPAGNPWFNGVEHDKQTVLEAFDALILRHEERHTDKRYNTLLRKLRNGLENYIPGRPFPFPSGLDKLLEAAENLRRGHAALVYFKKKFEWDPADCKAGVQFLEYVIGQALGTSIVKTTGLFKVIARYENIYHDLVRSRGCLSFSDINDVLRTLCDGSGQVLTTMRRCEADRLSMAYRLDGQFKHWLLDEFQDTSRAQWQVFEPLIDEVMQDPERQRTFFYVGDVKQAIYAWRGGDADLFVDVQRTYKEMLEERPLNQSWRSSPVILDTVNRVFSRLSDFSLDQDQLKPMESAALHTACQKWDARWGEHAAAPINTNLPGHTALYEVADSKEAEQDGRLDLLAELIRRYKTSHPRARTAVLVRGRKFGIKTMEYLRQHHLSASWEGDSAMMDTPLISGLVYLLVLADHPGDTALQRWAAMALPLEEHKISLTKAGRLILKQLHEQGFHFTLEYWIHTLFKTADLSLLEQQRLAMLLDVAVEYDRNGKKDALAFSELVRSQTVAESILADDIRILTIHKAKGLEYDAVFMPELDMQKGMQQLHALDLVHHPKNTIEDSEWVFQYPPRQLADADEVLQKQHQQEIEKQTYEALCLLYVAMTRAKQSLIMITKKPPEKPTSLQFSTLLRHQLVTERDPAPVPGISLTSSTVSLLYESGDATYTTMAPKDHPAETHRYTPHPFKEKSPRLRRRLPSSAADAQIDASTLFSVKKRDTAAFGTAIHALFERVEWIEEADIEDIARKGLENTAISPEMRQQVTRLFTVAAQSPAFQQQLRKKSPTAQLWREKRFEIALDDSWISGCFDRVEIHDDQAFIYDYKSNRVTTPEDKQHLRKTYHGQMALYRDVLHAMTGLPATSIHASLLLTHCGDVLELF